MVQCGMCGFAVVHRATPGNAGLHTMHIHSATLRWCDVQSPHLRSCKVQFCVRAKANFAFVQICVRTTIWVWVHAANLGLGTDL